MGGIMDYKARFYSPTLGRFLQPDSIVPDGTQGLNRFSYVRNNPVNFNDPTGHKPWRPREDNKEYTGFQRERRARLGLSYDDTLKPEQIRQLLGLDENEYSNWLQNPTNNKLNELLKSAHVGDIVDLVDGKTEVHLRIVLYRDGIALYDTDARQLLKGEGLSRFTKVSKHFKTGSILSDADGNGTFDGREYNLGGENLEVKGFKQYTLPDGWNKASDGRGRVEMQHLLNVNSSLVFAGAGTSTFLAFAGASSGPVTIGGLVFAPWFVAGVGLVGAGLTGYAAYKEMDVVPRYYDYIPHGGRHN
jgi:hypothetical protein